MYIINNETLYLYYDGINTYVKEEGSEYEFGGNLINRILDSSCIYYGSSLKGRIKGAKNILEGKYKLPIIISEKNDIIFFPVKGKKNNEMLWINFSKVKLFKKKNEFVEIVFNNNFVAKFMISFTVFNNQMFKSSRLWLIYLTRC